MIPVAQALDHLFALVGPLACETVPLRRAHGRVLAETVLAQRTQPPFAASAMDGYAVKSAEVETDALFKVIGESAAGHGFAGTVGAGQAVRIFTGAPVPQGADFVVIQEDVTRRGDLITLNHGVGTAPNIRPAGTDFTAGTPMNAPRRLSAGDVALLAAMNIAQVPVTRRPVVALISTGDELVMPGETPRDDQIIVSNTFGLAALLEDLGAVPRILPIARDTPAALRQVLTLAAGVDLIVTIGGASVGDHDLVAEVAAELGMRQSFYKVAMRPGKPLMAGMLGGVPMIGLPGNPVSAMVCGTVFLTPVIRAMQGLGEAPAPRRQMPLTAPLEANGPREHYMRAVADRQGVADAGRQDSSLLSVLATANALIVRPPDDPARDVGALVDVIDL
ncbi:molybdopterin molybdotransferase MoeA [Pseudosulfitobacter pseudonitzschiae]|uniref:molybdopterin molybdotransferase MoeA n=1 Tax=Pseudosulfitobacter pseudonitzschiae TaxID=1402135 RepID=UPI001AF20AB9|nr:gephyrin-like molybdotransferase Glp [Pseudosulfitobacter pseudonitzschiae]MBM1814420.1 molybdopterin molybdotransferase MoeA [Pseudosulfitobacter pseudonitzschiae]MBM1831413.1 molybdopterin molybdotransferase MoeA [Pseudosulfitobacter pseudonitzschiae]MBM1836280.1 molybdopterin molybdotransferase MoeA [Pseudosulfitobacter pseudonitzschiae]MBM1841126.1 molybdopterin molybdotransferase MoeA [Pseudosulfitobacter pseudonitzschiae]MBM1845994.1 molybdopterin molybdotransferase MoeA [Pseudosulfit